MSIITSILRRSVVISSPAVASSPCISQIRAISSSIPRRGLEEFFDPSRAPHEPVSVGRGWTADELRRKSFDDLHKLWYVLYKERNVLMTEELACKRNRGTMPAPHRKTLVRKSMARIKQVLREREIAERKARQKEEVAAKPQAASS